MLLSRLLDAPFLGGYARSCMRGLIDRPSTNSLGGGSGVVESWPSVRAEHVESSGVGDAAEVPPPGLL
jgi:hypothetical protein